MDERYSVSFQFFNLSNNISHNIIPYVRVTFVAVFVASFLISNVNGQQIEPLTESAPPPLKILTKSERSQLEAISDVKQRTKLALELMDVRLLKAEEFYAKEEYNELFTELGSFHALMDNTLEFLNKNNNDSGKILNNFKRIEISLRKNITRLELIRRELPAKYEFYVRSLIKYVRDARTRAVEPLFDNTVLQES